MAPIPRDLKEPDGCRFSSFRKMLLREGVSVFGGWLRLFGAGDPGVRMIWEKVKNE
jgi:hypothetical protein